MQPTWNTHPVSAFPCRRSVDMGYAFQLDWYCTWNGMNESMHYLNMWILYLIFFLVYDACNIIEFQLLLMIDFFGVTQCVINKRLHWSVHLYALTGMSLFKINSIYDLKRS